MKIPRSLVAITKCLVRAYGEVVTVFNYQCWMSCDWLGW
jgi:hypothetical protein